MDVLPQTPEPTNQPWYRRHQKPLAIGIGVVVILAGIGTTWALTHQSTKDCCASTVKKTPNSSPTPTPTPLLKASPLTGVMVDPALANRPIVSVVVENQTEARPQSGLSQAGVVYEALAEGGITRFQTFFLDGQPAAIGPVRSLRPYFVDWGFEFNAPVAHAGGSSTALNLAASLKMKDINALAVGAPIFYRVNFKAAPHNLYTSSALLDGLLAKQGFGAAASFTPSPRQADKPLASPTHPKIRLNYSYNGYQVDYTYDAAHNDYARSLAGAPHIDKNTGTQIHVKNVVVEYMPTSTFADGHLQMSTTGSGTGVVFRDGDAIPCTWKKNSRPGRTLLLDTAGKEIPLNAGNTWYSILPVGKTAVY